MQASTKVVCDPVTMRSAGTVAVVEFDADLVASNPESVWTRGSGVVGNRKIEQKDGK